MFGLELPDPENAQTKSSNMTELSACFREYCKEEEIGGDD
jgi:hypothetical protein